MQGMVKRRFYQHWLDVIGAADQSHICSMSHSHVPRVHCQWADPLLQLSGKKEQQASSWDLLIFNDICWKVKFKERMDLSTVCIVQCCRNCNDKPDQDWHGVSMCKKTHDSWATSRCCEEFWKHSNTLTIRFLRLNTQWHLCDNHMTFLKMLLRRDQQVAPWDEFICIMFTAHVRAVGVKKKGTQSQLVQLAANCVMATSIR